MFICSHFSTCFTARKSLHSSRYTRVATLESLHSSRYTLYSSQVATLESLHALQLANASHGAKRNHPAARIRGSVAATGARRPRNLRLQRSSSARRRAKISSASAISCQVGDARNSSPSGNR